MFRVVLWQVEATLLAAAVGVLIAGWRGLISAALGGAACVLPSLFLALYLKRISEHSGMDFLVRFLLGEIVKLALVAGSLFVVVAGGDFLLHMPSLLIGLVLATQVVFFLGVSGN